MPEQYKQDELWKYDISIKLKNKLSLKREELAKKVQRCSWQYEITVKANPNVKYIFRKGRAKGQKQNEL